MLDIKQYAKQYHAKPVVRRPDVEIQRAPTNPMPHKDIPFHRTGPDSVVGTSSMPKSDKAFDKKAYQRDYMRKRRAKSYSNSGSDSHHIM